MIKQKTGGNKRLLFFLRATSLCLGCCLGQPQQAAGWQVQPTAYTNQTLSCSLLLVCLLKFDFIIINKLPLLLFSQTTYLLLCLSLFVINGSACIQHKRVLAFVHIVNFVSFTNCDYFCLSYLTMCVAVYVWNDLWWLSVAGSDWATFCQSKLATLHLIWQQMLFGCTWTWQPLTVTNLLCHRSFKMSIKPISQQWLSLTCICVYFVWQCHDHDKFFL